MQTNKLTAIITGIALTLITIILLTTVFDLGLILAIIIGSIGIIPTAPGGKSIAIRTAKAEMCLTLSIIRGLIR